MKVSRKTLADTIRILTIDAVQNANSGHPGMPMGMADIAEVLWNDFLRFDPNNPNWFNRDRFIVSNGHGSMLLYSLLHLSGYDLSIEELKQFRQLHSKTPGHPEYGVTPGVDTTTGPLGQGLANAVGMAVAEQVLSADFSTPELPIVDHYTYCFVGDGCLMEGISHEVCSLAGTLQLSKLIVFWDDNGVSIDGATKDWFTDNTQQRFLAYNWQVLTIDGHNPDEIKNAIIAAQQNTSKPSFIACKTIIGYGSPNMAGDSKVHGAPLGVDEIKAVRDNLAWSQAPFKISPDIYAAWDARERGRCNYSNWQQLLSNLKASNKKLYVEFIRRCIDKQLPIDFTKQLTKLVTNWQNTSKDIPLSTRKASQQVLTACLEYLPELLGGSADLSGSNLTLTNNSHILNSKKLKANYIYYGVREFGMSAIMNGLALHGGIIPYGGTFLTFADYARNAIRMAALMKINSIFVYTHDSIGLGEDGPTHQPIEHLAMLRATPNLQLWRPCDLVETGIAWREAISRLDGPSALIFSRQNLSPQSRSNNQINMIAKGGYILKMPNEKPQLIILATGSEVQLAMAAADILSTKSYKVQVVSMPCLEVFAMQDSTYKQTVLPRKIKARIAIEAGSTINWHKLVGDNGAVIGMDCFGESAPAKDLFKYFGFTVQQVVTKAEQIVKAEPVLEE